MFMQQKMPMEHCIALCNSLTFKNASRTGAHIPFGHWAMWLLSSSTKTVLAS